MEKLELFDKVFEIQRKGKECSNDELDELLRQYPDKFYRYQKFTNDNIETLKSKCAYFSCPNTWPDKTDATMLFDIDKDKSMLEENQKAYVVEYSKSLFSAAARLTNREPISYDSFEKIYDDCVINGEFDENRAYDILKEEIGIGKAESVIKKFEKEQNKMRIQVEKSLEQLTAINSLRDRMAVLCLSENYDNENQWDKYAAGGKGFCIEYTINFSSVDEPFKSSCLPILYGMKTPLSILDYIRERIDCLGDKKKENEFINRLAYQGIKSFFTKDSTFAGECEWRFSLQEKYKNSNVSFPFATRIILGNNMSSHNEKRLQNIANKLKIDVYKRSLDATKSKWNYYLVRKNKDNEGNE